MNFDQATPEDGSKYALLWAKGTDFAKIRALAHRLGSTKMVEADPDVPAVRLYESRIPTAARADVDRTFAPYVTEQAMNEAVAQNKEREDRRAATNRVADMVHRAADDREIYYVPRTMMEQFRQETRAARVETKWDTQNKVHVGVRGPEGKLEGWRSDEMKARQQAENTIIEARTVARSSRGSLFGKSVSAARDVQDGMSLSAEYPNGIRMPSDDADGLDGARRDRARELLARVIYEPDLKAVIKSTAEQRDLAEIRMVTKIAEAKNAPVQHVAANLQDYLFMHTKGETLPISEELQVLDELKNGQNALYKRLREIGYGAERSNVSDREAGNNLASRVRDMRTASDTQKSVGVPLSHDGQARMDAGITPLAVRARGVGGGRRQAPVVDRPAEQSAGVGR